MDKRSRNMVPSSIGYCYSDHMVSPTTTTTSFDNPNPQIYNNHNTTLSTTSMEMLGFQPKMGSSSSSWQQHHHGDGDGDDHSRSLLVDDPSLRCHVFPCEGNERPSQGLSLSLNSTNPSTIGLQSFELRQQQQHDGDDGGDDGYYGKSMLFEGENNNYHQNQMIKNSRYLGPAQELLYEFCNLGTNYPPPQNIKIKKPHNNNNQRELDANDDHNHNNSTNSISITPSLSTPQLLQLQNTKTNLFSMLEQVDRRYRHYCDQMKAVVSSFEAVAGNGAATVYTAMASRVMSRYFRCLRDGIVGQIKATKKAMGEDTACRGATRGETPRLRLLEQTMRQHRAFQQRSLMESHPWRPQRGLPERSVSVLRAWLFEHFLHPYPSDVDKHILARQTGLSRNQVSNWFINARVRLWKPMVEEMYLEETKEHQNNNINNNSSDGNATAVDDDRDTNDHQQPHQPSDDHKPTPDQLFRNIDSDQCLSSIINNNNNNNKNHYDGGGRFADAFGAMELDFSSSYANQSMHHGFGGGGGVSLTLGLQQHEGNGVSMGAFTGASQGSSSSMFYPRNGGGGEQIEDCQQVMQYSLLDSSEGQNLNYRNLMGAQLLHDQF